MGLDRLLGDYQVALAPVIVVRFASRIVAPVLVLVDSVAIAVDGVGSKIPR